MIHLEGEYNLLIVALSVLIAILVSFNGLHVTSKIAEANKKQKYFWLIAGAVVMGNGIWSFHFIGMLSFRLEIATTYSLFLTILSMFASVLASFIAFYLIMLGKRQKLNLLLGSFFMGTGIVAMHYFGMAAIDMPATVIYNPMLVIFSVLIALIGSYAALSLFNYMNHLKPSLLFKWGASILMGGTISSMHYMGMNSATIYINDPSVLTEYTINSFLIFGVFITLIVITIASWVIMFYDRNVLEKIAFIDSLTGLFNRHKMSLYFDRLVGRDNIGVLLLDLDNFKIINDTPGHQVGDLVIKEIGNRLKNLSSSTATPFRIAGDEFLFIAENMNEQNLIILVEQVLESIKQPYLIGESELFLTGSIGVSMGSVESSNPSLLLQNADTAMDHTKQIGKNRYSLFNEKMGVEEIRRMNLVKYIHRAMENDELFIVYQPKWNVKTDTLHGFEALLRWKHPDLGLVSPMEFIPIAEETGAIIPMTRWILKSACFQAKTWQEKYVDQPVSVNLSTKLFQTESLPDLVKETMEETKLDASLLELEITESMVLHDIEEVRSQLDKIRALGVKVSLDDFGVGYSSIGVLDQIPLDILKLDRLFANDLGKDSKCAIIHAIILMAESLNLDIVAEGIETKEQMELLSDLGCYIMQGYYYSKPMQVHEIEVWLQGKLA